MSNFEISDNKLVNNNSKYSLDEIEISEKNTTNQDSLHNDKIIMNANMKEKQELQKYNNYYLAISSIKRIKDDISKYIGINEFSQISKTCSKNKNIEKYINNPLIKDIIKIGNILKTIKTEEKEKNIISNNFTKEDIYKSIDYNSKSLSNFVNDDKNIIQNKKLFFKKKGHQSENKNITSTGGTKLNIISDLELPEELKINYDGGGLQKLHNISSKNAIRQCTEIESQKFQNNKKKFIVNSRAIKSFDFRNLRKNNNNYHSIYEINHKKKWSNVDLILKHKNTKTTTNKKLRKKYERSELKSNKQQTNSYYHNIKISSIDEDIFCIHEDEDMLAKNLMGKFDLCGQGEDMPNNHILNDYIDENLENVEFIDFLSNESGNYKQNINNASENSEVNDTVIIKENENTNIENKKKINNFNSPNKIRDFKLEPFDNSDSKKSKYRSINNALEKFSSLKIGNFSIVKPKGDKENVFLDLSYSPLYIESSSKSKSKSKANNSIKISVNHIDEEEQKLEPKSIYDLEFYENLIKLSNKLNKKMDFNRLYLKKLIFLEKRLETLLWMMKICEEFAFKRDTYHYSCFYFDTYLSKNKGIDKKEYKLIGITCISISAKIEEVQIPKLREYEETLSGTYKIKDIIDTEKKICSSLGWKLIPVTISIWINWYTCQWDLFVDNFEGVKNKLLLFTSDDDILYFKRQSEISYYNYRRIYQLIDLIILDYKFHKYEIRYLIAACFLVSICLYYNLEFDFIQKSLKIRKDKKSELKLKNLARYKIGKILLEIYINFIEQSFNFSFDDKNLIQSIKYVYKFFNFKFIYEIPLIFQVENIYINDYTYEDFISYQTTCTNLNSFCKEMLRKETQIIKRKKIVHDSKHMPFASLVRKSQKSITSQSTLKNKKSNSSRKSSLTKDNSKIKYQI
jgi:hypothetical protein